MRTIQVRPCRDSRWQKQGGWEVYEGEGVCPVCCDPGAGESAFGYAHQRAGYAPTRRKVLDRKWTITNVIPAVSRHALI
jgi:hypothetical protein